MQPRSCSFQESILLQLPWHLKEFVEQQPQSHLKEIIVLFMLRLFSLALLLAQLSILSGFNQKLGKLMGPSSPAEKMSN